MEPTVEDAGGPEAGECGLDLLEEEEEFPVGTSEFWELVEELEDVEEPEEDVEELDEVELPFPS